MEDIKEDNGNDEGDWKIMRLYLGLLKKFMF